MDSKESLKVICLNTWAGMIGLETLLAFFKAHQDIDIFCLQEVYNAEGYVLPKTAAGKNIETVVPDLLDRLKSILSDYSYLYTPQYVPYLGIAIFYRKNFHLIDEGELCIYREPGYVSSNEIADHARIMQYVTLETKHSTLTILNLHAAWQKIGKIDTSERLEQSKRIISFTNKINHPMILCGDFNLLPDTKSVKMIEGAGWENLIRTHGITSTRTSIYDKSERFADYVFVKNGIEVQDFQVLPEEVSDHAALLLECSL